MLLTRLLGVRAADHLRAVLDGLLAVERPLRGKRTSAARSPRPPATWASALVSHLTAREALADHLRILEHRREVGGEV